jgi:hypothetical protein
MDLLAQLLGDKTEMPHKQIGFFGEGNLDKNIQGLKRSLRVRQQIRKQSHNKSINRSSRYSNNDGDSLIINTHKKHSMNSYIYPIELSDRTRSIIVPTPSNLGNFKSARLSDAKILKERQNRDEKNIRFMYNKIFSKEYQEVSKKTNLDIEHMEGDRRVIGNESSRTEGPYMRNELIDVKSRILFIKNIFDYTYPKIMVEKLKTMKDIIHKMKVNREEKEVMKVVNKEKNKTKIVLQSSSVFSKGNIMGKKKTETKNKLPELMPVLYHSSTSFYTASKRSSVSKNINSNPIFFTNNTLTDY